MSKNTNPPVYTVKRFGFQYWIEKDGDHFHGRVKPLMDISVPKYFNNSNDAWKWVEYLEEGVVDVPKPPRFSPTGMCLDTEVTLDNAFDEPKPVRNYNIFNP